MIKRILFLLFLLTPLYGAEIGINGQGVTAFLDIDDKGQTVHTHDFISGNTYSNVGNYFWVDGMNGAALMMVAGSPTGHIFYNDSADTTYNIYAASSASFFVFFYYDDDTAPNVQFCRGCNTGAAGNDWYGFVNGTSGGDKFELKAQKSTGAYFIIADAVASPQHTWMLLTAVHEPNNWYFYVNDRYVGTVADTTDHLNQYGMNGLKGGFFIGGICSGTNDGTNFGTGTYDCFAFYNRALSASEIQRIYQLLMGRK